MSPARPAARACSCSMTARGPCAGSAACAVTARTGPPRETEVIGDPAGDSGSTQDGDTRPADGDAARAVRGPADRGRAWGVRAAGAAPTYGRQLGTGGTDPRPVRAHAGLGLRSVRRTGQGAP